MFGLLRNGLVSYDGARPASCFGDDMTLLFVLLVDGVGNNTS